MGRKAPFTYRDSIALLRPEDSKLLKAADTLLGGALLGVAVAGGNVLSLFDAKNELVSVLRSLVLAVRRRLAGAPERERRDLVVAAHTVIVVTAYFEALREVLGRQLGALEISRQDQLYLFSLETLEENFGKGYRSTLLDVILDAQVPTPSPAASYEANRRGIGQLYTRVSERVSEFIQGLSTWEEVHGSLQDRWQRAIIAEVPDRALRRYEELYLRAATEVHEFFVWASLQNQIQTSRAIAESDQVIQERLQAISHEMRRHQSALEQLEQILRIGQTEASEGSPRWRKTLIDRCRRVLMAPLIDPERTGLDGLCVPAVQDIYIAPSFRLADGAVGRPLAVEAWWSSAPLRNDMMAFMAGYLTSPASSTQPLLLLGHPGSGKSLLTKILAARLPTDRYATLRVELRYVTAAGTVIDHIEDALSRETNERVSWREYVDSTNAQTRVILLDGLDELLQAAGGAERWRYVRDIQRIQEVELDRGTPVAFVITARTVSLTSVEVPAGVIVAKLEDFNDDQTSAWLASWNQANAEYYHRRGLRPCPFDVVARQGSLARQPLLLLMLVLHDAGSNALQNEAGLNRVELYERLLAGFVVRELGKGTHEKERVSMGSGPPTPDTPAAWRIEERLHELGIVALAMFNRRQQHVFDDELAEDFRGLDVHRISPAGEGGGKIRSDPDQVANQFFFVHTAQAVHPRVARRAYEFLHLTFAEYLVAREVLNTLAHCTAASGVESDVRTSGTRGDRLYALLSFEPLLGLPQVCSFIEQMVSSGHLVKDVRGGVLRFLQQAQRDTLLGHGSLGQLDRYQPRVRPLIDRLAAWSYNLLFLQLIIASVTVPLDSALAGYVDGDVAIERWRKLFDFWKSQLPDSCIRAALERLRLTSAHDRPGLVWSSADDRGVEELPYENRLRLEGELVADPARIHFAAFVDVTKTAKNGEDLRQAFLKGALDAPPELLLSLGPRQLVAILRQEIHDPYQPLNPTFRDFVGRCQSIQGWGAAPVETFADLQRAADQLIDGGR